LKNVAYGMWQNRKRIVKYWKKRSFLRLHHRRRRGATDPLNVVVWLYPDLKFPKFQNRFKSDYILVQNLHKVIEKSKNSVCIQKQIQKLYRKYYKKLQVKDKETKRFYSETAKRYFLDLKLLLLSSNKVLYLRSCWRNVNNVYWL
jgi:hypothetical protein